MWRLAAWQLTPRQRLEFLQQALDLGVTTIDHADIYGSELPFGEALALAPALRHKMEIVTKCGIVPGTPEAPVNYYDTSAAHIIRSLENSLRLLHTDYIDVLLIHRPDPLMQADEVAAAFEQLHAAGKVRYFGVSNFTPAQFDLLASRHPLVTNQVELSPLFLTPLHDGTLDQCQQRGIAPMIWSALAGGRLFQEDTDQTLRLRKVLDELARHFDVSATTIVYAWLLQHPSRPVVLTGSGRIAVVKDAVAALEITLTRAQWFAIWSASTGTSVP
jgi:predicted oxidoreductase